MASSEKKRASKFDFNPWPGLNYVIDPNLPPDQFFTAPGGIFHIGAGTDLHARLFWLKLTRGDRGFLKKLFIDPDH